MKSPNSIRILGLSAGLTLSSAVSSAALVVWEGGGATTPIGDAFDSSGVWLNFFTGSVNVLQSGDAYPLYALGQFQITLSSASGYANIVNQTPFLDAAEWITFGNGPGRLMAGEVVDGFSEYTDNFTIFASIGTDFYNSFDDLGTGFFGVRFTDAAVNTYYGYIEVTMNPDFTITLDRFAYDNVPLTPVVTGAIPEPASAVALAGLAAVAAAAGRRRQRRA